MSDTMKYKKRKTQTGALTVRTSTIAGEKIVVNCERMLTEFLWQDGEITQGDPSFSAWLKIGQRKRLRLTKADATELIKALEATLTLA